MLKKITFLITRSTELHLDFTSNYSQFAHCCGEVCGTGVGGRRGGWKMPINVRPSLNTASGKDTRDSRLDYLSHSALHLQSPPSPILIYLMLPSNELWFVANNCTQPAVLKTTMTHGFYQSCYATVNSFKCGVVTLKGGKGQCWHRHAGKFGR